MQGCVISCNQSLPALGPEEMSSSSTLLFRPAVGVMASGAAFWLRLLVGPPAAQTERERCATMVATRRNCDKNHLADVLTIEIQVALMFLLHRGSKTKYSLGWQLVNVKVLFSESSTCCYAVLQYRCNAAQALPSTLKYKKTLNKTLARNKLLP